MIKTEVPWTVASIIICLCFIILIGIGLAGYTVTFWPFSIRENDGGEGVRFTMYSTPTIYANSQVDGTEIVKRNGIEFYQYEIPNYQPGDFCALSWIGTGRDRNNQAVLEKNSSDDGYTVLLEVNPNGGFVRAECVRLVGP